MKRPGRPPLDALSPSTAVHLKLPARDYDRVHALAKQRRASVQDVIRTELKRLLTERRI